MTHEEDLDFERAEMLGWEESEMDRLSKHLKAGKKISSPDLAKVLRATMNTEIPGNVRQAIIDLLDDEVKTGRSRRPRYFHSADYDFRNMLIRDQYRALRAKGINSDEALHQLGEEFFLARDTVQSIVKSNKRGRKVET